MTALRESSRPLVRNLTIESTSVSFSPGPGVTGLTRSSGLPGASVLPRISCLPQTSSVDESEARYRALAIKWVVAVTAIRFVCVASVPLGNGEAYYFTWSRFLSWSYYDHPPLLAWIERLTTLLSPSLAAIRLGPILCSAAFGLLFHRLADRLFGARAAFLSLILVTAIPVFLATSIVLNPEAPLAPLWVGYLLVLEGMRERDDTYRPLLAGALLGLAFLAKYTAVLLVPTTFLYLLLSAPARRWLRRPSLYAGGAIALFVALPVLYWNVAHDWPTLHLHFVERASVGLPVAGENRMSHLIEDASTPGSSAVERLARLLVGQGLAYSPFFAPALVMGLLRILRGARRDDRDLFLAAFSWPVLILLLGAMLKLKDAEAHWTMVALLPAEIAVGRAADESLGSLATARGAGLAPIAAIAKRFPVLGAGVAVSALLFVFGTVHTHSDALVRLFPSAHYDPRADMTNELAGWDQVRAHVERAAEATRGDVVLASNQYAMCGRLMVETADAPKVYCPTERRSAFDFFERNLPPRRATVLVLTSDIHREVPASLEGRACTLADDFAVERAGREVAHYFIHSCSPDPAAVERRASLD